MRPIIAYSILVVLSLLGSQEKADATPPPLPEPIGAPATDALAKTALAKITPHSAVYLMELSSTKNNSSVSGVSGRMEFEWNDICDAWTVTQRLQMSFDYNDGDSLDIESSELSWESKDMKGYSFNVRRFVDGQETESYRGKAARSENGAVKVTYSAPEEKTIELQADTMFPLAHTLLIMRAANEGEKLFSRRIFDGSDSEGSTDISAFILPAKKGNGFPLPSKLKNHRLLAQKPWPIHLAFFKTDPNSEEPDYEMDLELLPNGIAKHMKIDYGDFTVTGRLDEIKELKPQSCP